MRTENYEKHEWSVSRYRSVTRVYEMGKIVRRGKDQGLDLGSKWRSNSSHGGTEMRISQNWTQIITGHKMELWDFVNVVPQTEGKIWFC